MIETAGKVEIMNQGLLGSGARAGAAHVRRWGKWQVLALLAASLCVGALAPAARGQCDNFNDGSDALWTHYDPLGLATFSFPNGGYEISTTPSPYPPQYGPSRAASIRQDVTYSAHFSVAVDLVALEPYPQDEAAGVLARLSNVGAGTSDGYAFTYGTGGRDIDINRLDNEQTTLLARTQITLDPSSLPSNEYYRMVFTGNGALLTGTVYLVDTDNEFDTSDPLASISATDGTYPSGYSGLVTFDNTDPSEGSNGTDATFDNYYAVPEPAVGTILMAAAPLSLLRRPRNRLPPGTCRG